MITAVLEDKKHFRKAIEIPRILPEIKIFLPPDPIFRGWANDWEKLQSGQELGNKEILTFRFTKMLEGRVALYKER